LLKFNPAASTSTHGYSSATWRFGDGSQTSFFSGSAALTPATHSYQKSGRYTVTLTLVDNRGTLQSKTRRVTVHRHT
jgi:PKD repeat protein